MIGYKSPITLIDPDFGEEKAQACVNAWYQQLREKGGTISHLNMQPDPPLPGAIGTYIHAGGKIGVLVELECQSEFVSRTEDFSQLMHELAMQIAASDPKFIRKEDVTHEAYECEKDIYRSQAIASGKSPHSADKMVEGRMAKFYEEVCLYEQPFIKDQTISVSQLIAANIEKLGENISVRRFARFKVGDNFTRAASRYHESEGGEEAGIAVKKPKGPKLDSGAAAVKPDSEAG